MAASKKKEMDHAERETLSLVGGRVKGGQKKSSNLRGETFPPPAEKNQASLSAPTLCRDDFALEGRKNFLKRPIKRG